MNSALKKDNLTVLSEFLHKRENIDPARVTPEASLEELKVDSLLLLELLFEFEDRLGVMMPQDILRFKSVGDLLGLLAKLTRGYAVFLTGPLQVAGSGRGQVTASRAG